MSYPTARVTSRQDGIAAIEVYPRAYYRQVHFLPEGEAEQWIQVKLYDIRTKNNAMASQTFNPLPDDDRWVGYESEEYEPEEPLPSETMITEYDKLFLPENTETETTEATQENKWTNVKRKYKKINHLALDRDLHMLTPDSPK